MSVKSVVECDKCGKTVEQSVEVTTLPDGWLTVTIVSGVTEKRGSFHSRSCAAAWVGKRVRTPRVKAPVNQGGQA